MDCLVIGGGPAGLSAAIYLARYHLSVKVVDRANGRALSIPHIRNYAGFPSGISGKELLSRMRNQMEVYGASIFHGEITHLTKVDGGFRAHWNGGLVTARKVLLATGLTNHPPIMREDLHAEAVSEGLIRYCPVCDGFEVTDKTVAVIGSGTRGTSEAMFLRGFTQDITLIAPHGPHALEKADHEKLANFTVRCMPGPYVVDRAGKNLRKLAVLTPIGEHHFDAIYPALGSVVHSKLAKQIGALLREDGTIVVDSHQRSTVAGIYAAGDVVTGLNQISHAVGESAVAATAIRNELAMERPLVREELG